MDYCDGMTVTWGVLRAVGVLWLACAAVLFVWVCLLWRNDLDDAEDELDRLRSRPWRSR
jgi:hypothetical protein